MTQCGLQEGMANGQTCSTRLKIMYVYIYIYMYSPFPSFHMTTNITLTETNIAPENGWLEDDRFLFGWPMFRGYQYVSFSETISYHLLKIMMFHC